MARRHEALSEGPLSVSVPPPFFPCPYLHTFRFGARGTAFLGVGGCGNQEHLRFLPRAANPRGSGQLMASAGSTRESLPHAMDFRQPWGHHRPVLPWLVRADDGAGRFRAPALPASPSLQPLPPPSTCPSQQRFWQPPGPVNKAGRVSRCNREAPFLPRHLPKALRCPTRQGPLTRYPSCSEGGSGETWALKNVLGRVAFLGEGGMAVGRAGGMGSGVTALGWGAAPGVGSHGREGFKQGRDEQFHPELRKDRGRGRTKPGKLGGGWSCPCPHPPSDAGGAEERDKVPQGRAYGVNWGQSAGEGPSAHKWLRFRVGPRPHPHPSTQDPAQHLALSRCPINTVNGQMAAPVSASRQDPLTRSGSSCPVDGRGLRAPGVLAPSACGQAQRGGGCWGGWAGGGGTSWLPDSCLPRVTASLAGNTGNFQVLPTRPPPFGSSCFYHLPSPCSLGARPACPSTHVRPCGGLRCQLAAPGGQAPLTAPAESSPHLRARPRLVG